MLELFLKYKEFYISGIFITLKLSFLSVLTGTIIGMILSLLRMSKNKILSFVSTAYVEVIRGTPLLVQIFIVYYTLTNLGFSIFMIGYIAVSINSGAYVCELIRSGIEAVDKGQKEAGLSLGMSKISIMRKIIMPQAIKNILPALAGEFVTVIKETSIVANLGLADIYYCANSVGLTTYRYLEALYIGAIIYFVITFSLSKLIGIFERRLKQVD